MMMIGNAFSVSALSLFASAFLPRDSLSLSLEALGAVLAVFGWKLHSLWKDQQRRPTPVCFGQPGHEQSSRMFQLFIAVVGWRLHYLRMCAVVENE